MNPKTRKCPGIIDKMKETDPRYARMAMNDIIHLRELRRCVRQMASFVSPEKRIFEQQGPLWAADFENNVITWAPFSVKDPTQLADEEERLFLIGHEAAHLEYTGKYQWPDHADTDEKKTKFHRFVNGFEDIRIERIMEEEWGGFAEPRKNVYEAMMDVHLKNGPGGY